MTHLPKRKYTPERLRDIALLQTIFPGFEALAGRHTTRTTEEYTWDAIVYLRFCHFDADHALKPATLRAWRAYMVDETTLSPNTINRRLIAIKTLVKASAIVGAIKHTLAYEFSLVERVQIAPLRERLKPHTRVLLTPEQVRALCQAPDPTTLVGLRDRALLITLASSGIRIHEAATLKRHDIVPLGPGWSLSVLGKGQDTTRQAPLSKEAYVWTQRWLKARDHLVQSEWVFTALDYGGKHAVGHPLSRNSLIQRVKEYTAQVGLGHISAHHLRRFVGSTVAKTHGLRQGQKALGHKVMKTFEAYYLLDDMEPGLTDELF